MDYLLDKLVRETARFLEICQEQVVLNRIGIKDYIALTSTKFDFIDKLLESEQRLLFIDKSFQSRLDNLLIKDYDLCSSLKQIVSN
jgi:hypothetical protein